MATSGNTGVISSSFPLLPPTSTEYRLRHFGDAYNIDASTLIFKLVDALAGDSGAGDLKKRLTITRLSNQIDSIYFRDLDRLFGNGLGFHRLSTESYAFDPGIDMLTHDEWDSVRTKDAAYKQRIKNLMTAIGYGGTPRGFKLAVFAAVGCECDIYETWKYIDDLGYGSNLGRTGVTLRNEVVIRPWNPAITLADKYLILQVLDRFKPVDTVITVSTSGLAVNDPIVFRGVSTDSTYFEIQKTITGATDIASIGASEVLLSDLVASQNWLIPGQAVVAPTAAFNSSQESSFYYFASSIPGGGFVDRITYQTDRNGVIADEANFQADLSALQTYTGWKSFDLADSPDNYPGGKFGQTPATAPALAQDGGAYVFQWVSQADYEVYATNLVIQNGGQVQDNLYRVPIGDPSPTTRVFLPIEAVPTEAPQRESTVSSTWLQPNVLLTSGDRGLS